MLVYVLNKDGQPLMPTDRCGKIRRLLRNKKAKVISRCPFTVQLLYETGDTTQPVSLGVDAGSKHIGVSATTENRVLYEADVVLRNDISDLLSARKTLRSTRRNRKTRYRKPRFDNRLRKEGWLAPSVQHKIDTHLAVIAKAHKMLPINTIAVEVTSFNTQLIKAQLEGRLLLEGKDYQQGELLGWNLREYVLFRDGYTCQWCKGKSKSKILHTHHWNYWNGDHSNKPSSLITLCNVCNNSKNHKKDSGFLWGWKPKTTQNFRDIAFMNTMRRNLYNQLREIYPIVKLTYGYITKHTRTYIGLPKEHYIDARCISGNPTAISDGTLYFQKKIRCHNRQIHKTSIRKNGIRHKNQAPYFVNGFRLFDKVLFKNKECFIFGRRSSGAFDVRLLDGTKLSSGISYKKIVFLETRKPYLTERRKAICST